jgi:hypothetical protein
MSSHHCIVECEESDPKHKGLPNEGKESQLLHSCTDPLAGTASDPQPDGSRPPKLFESLKIRGVTLQNRIMVLRRTPPIR